MPDQQNAPTFPRRFTGKTVLVTGAGTGFGAEIAVRAAQEGARVVVHYNRSREGAEDTAKRIEQAGSEAALVQADITSWDQIRALADAAFAAFGGLDVAVNNVGDVARDQMSWRDITEESIDHVLAVDVKGTLLCTQEFGSRMVEAGGGCVINIGSTVIVRGSARAPQYAAAKYGILGITKSYAQAFAPTVRVNTFAPGLHRDPGHAEPAGLEERARRAAPLDDPDGPDSRAGRGRGHRAVPGHAGRVAHDRRVPGGRRRLQHGRRLTVPGG